jgi:hypothetical protein
MRSKSAPGSSTPTSRLTNRLGSPVQLLIAAVLLPLATAYVIAAFVAPNPLIRIALRTIPVIPVAIWTLWFDPSRPFERQTAAIRIVARVALLVLVMAVAIGVLGVGLNWLDDPARVI